MKRLLILCFQIALVAPVAFGQKQDLTPIVETLRAEIAAEVDGNALHRTFEQHDLLAPEAHFRLLQLILDDPTLADHLVLNSTAFVPDSPRLALRKVEGESLTKAIARQSRDQILQLLEEAPADLAPVLLLPAIFQDRNIAAMVLAIITDATDRATFTPEREDVEDLMTLGEFPIDRAPPRYREILELSQELALLSFDDTDSTRSERINEAAKRAEAMLAQAELPVSARLGIAGMALYSFEDQLPARTKILFATWLAEGWRRGVPMDYFLTEPRILENFYGLQPSPEWKVISEDLVRQFPERFSHPRDLHRATRAWMIGIAVETGNIELAREWNAAIPTNEIRHPLPTSPLLPILIRSGMHRETLDLLADQKHDLLGERRTHSDFPYDRRLADQIAQFIPLIESQEVSYLVDLHLALLENHPDPNHAPMVPRAERLLDLAREFDQVEFQSFDARLTALELLGSEPRIAGEITDALLAVTDFEKADLFLAGRDADQWSRIAIQTISALINASQTTLALEKLEQLRVHTDVHEINAVPDSHHAMWDGLRTLLRSVDTIEIREFPKELPDHFFPISKNFRF